MIGPFTDPNVGHEPGARIERLSDDVGDRADRYRDERDVGRAAARSTSRAGSVLTAPRSPGRGERSGSRS